MCNHIGRFVVYRRRAQGLWLTTEVNVMRARVDGSRAVKAWSSRVTSHGG
jgi:hypothetical protein